MRALLILLLALCAATEAEASDRTTCWRQGAYLKCRTEQASPPAQGWQPSKETTCWRNGANTVCETR